MVKPFDDAPDPGETLLTTLTITSCPTTAKKGESFKVVGKLVVKTTGSPLEGATVNLYYMKAGGTWNLLGSDLTDSRGVFEKSVAINEVGLFTVLANFNSIPGKYAGSGDSTTIEIAGAPPPNPPEPGEGAAEIIEIELPGILEAGEWITGYVRVRNNGSEDQIRLLEVRGWSGAKKTTTMKLGPQYVMKVPIEVKMPSEDAKIYFEAQHLKGVEWITDHRDTHTVMLEEEPWWQKTTNQILLGMAAVGGIYITYKVIQGVRIARPYVVRGYEYVRPRVEEAVEYVRPRVERGVEYVRERI